jgi:NAD(P)-dependent dehydrogenase (short-subunit alcohol dehydrogenase family)
MKTVLITGGSRGIGLASALRFSKEGWNVYITSRKEENLQAVLKDHPELKGFVAKADDLAAANATCKAIVDETGSLDVLINNAGTNPSAGSILEVELSAIQKTWDVNLM